MPQLKPDDGLSMFQRYRRERQRSGMKLPRIWVPDPPLPDFAEEAVRQAALLKGAPEETEALRFIEAVFDWPDR